MSPLPPLRDLFVSPAWIAATGSLALAALASAVFWGRRETARRTALVSASMADRAGVPAGRARRRAAGALAISVLAGTGLSLARPRWGGAETERAQREGTDVVILLDTSASMRAADLSPSRFVLAKQAIESLLSRLPEDRLALVACEGEAQTLVPLTLDSAAVALFLDAVEPGVGTLPGTSISAGLATALELLPPLVGAGRQIVLVSDGEDLEGGVEEAATRAREAGIVVHTVLVGSRGAPVPETDVTGRVSGYKNSEGGPVVSRPNPGLLRDLSARTGGSFTVVSPGQTDLDGVAREIDRAARRPLSESLLTTRPERYQWPLGFATGALALLLLGLPSLGLRRTAGASAAAAGAAARTAGVPATLVALALLLPASAFSQVTPAALEARSEAKRGAAALEAKKPEEAAAHFSRQRQLAPKDPTGAFNACTALAAARKVDDAVSACDEARRSGRASRDLRRDAAYNEGTALLGASKYETAAKAFRDALRLSPGDPDAAFNYELSLRRAQEEKQRHQQQTDRKNPDQKKNPGSTPTPAPDPRQQQQEKQRREDEEFRRKANMSREKAEQLLSAIQNADRDEQRRRLADHHRDRKRARDW